MREYVMGGGQKIGKEKRDLRGKREDSREEGG